MKGGFELDVGDQSGVGSVVKERIGQGTAQTLVKEEEEDGTFTPLSVRR